MKIFDLVLPALNLGCEFKIYKEGGVFCIDLNTQAKSGCILKQKSDEVYAYRRYGSIELVKDFEHLLDLVYGCAHGRSFFSSDWLDVFEAYGYGNPCL